MSYFPFEFPLKGTSPLYHLAVVKLLSFNMVIQIHKHQSVICMQISNTKDIVLDLLTIGEQP